jgi:hypothetical protein
VTVDVDEEMVSEAISHQDSTDIGSRSTGNPVTKLSEGEKQRLLVKSLTDV